MIIYSWNMLYENKELTKALVFIERASFDIFCLQEVPEDFLLSLKSLPYHSAYVCEVELTTKLRAFPIYSVILSKYPILNREEITCADIPCQLRTNITRYILGFLSDERVIKMVNRKAFFVDVKVEGKPVRVHNLHLPLSHPSQRIKELQSVMEKNSLRERTILCGDFNILETFYISVLNWLLGGKLSDWFLYRNERKNIELYFKKVGFLNPFRNKITHPVSQSQLDHIVISQSCNVIRSTVIANRFGSDHRPIYMDVEL